MGSGQCSWRASFTAWMSCLTFSTVFSGVGDAWSSFFLLTRPATPAAAKQRHGHDQGSRPNRQGERQRGDRGGDDAGQAEHRQQTGRADQSRTDACMFGGVDEFVLCQAHFIAHQPRGL